MVSQHGSLIEGAHSSDGLSPPKIPGTAPLSQFLASAILATLILAASAFGLFRPLDDALQEIRYGLLNRHPTGQIVFVEIDAASLQAVGVWPWPRTIYASIVDRLSDMGAKSMTFDIDFSAASTQENDRAFAAALKRAGGFAILGAFEQSAGPGNGTVVNRPIAELAQESEVVSVDVPLGVGNLIRDYPSSRTIGNERTISLGASLANARSENITTSEGLFGLNFAIDLNEIDRISVADLLSGKVEVDRLRGRDVVIGASAQELRDMFATPRFGMVPGGLVHILAGETLLQGVSMHDASWQWIVAIITALALLAGFLGDRFSRLGWLFRALGLAAFVELGALWLQGEQALRFNSGAIHVALGTFVIAGIVTDLRLRRRLHAHAASEREFMRSMLRQVIADDLDGVIILNETGKILASSQVAQDFLMCSSDNTSDVTLPEPLAKLANDCFTKAGDDPLKFAATGELALSVLSKGLRYLHYVVTLSSIGDQNSIRVVCLTFRDVTERRNEQELLKFLAKHDPSTGAWLRHELITNMETLLARSAGSKTIALILVEVRRLASITNLHGDAVGDFLLQSLTSRLRAEGYPMVARIGDANFAIAGPCSGEHLSVARLNSMIERIVKPYTIGPHTIMIGVDVGMATSSVGGIRAEGLLTQARIAQAVARNGAVDGLEIFSPKMEAEFKEREWIVNALREALAQGNQFSLEYQPQFDLASDECTGAEALIRWHHPERGLISPGKFIAIAEETRLIVDMGRWALQTACNEAASWPERMRVAVNVSPIQLESPELRWDLYSALEMSGLAPNRLTIELTESAFVSGGIDTIATLQELRNQGVGIAIDDFGTGFSSLGYLDRLPFDEIKIDQAFIKRFLVDSGAASIVQSILQLADKLGKTVVAEGVESEAQADLLKKLGCPIVQGYFYGRPIAASEFHKFFIAKAVRLNSPISLGSESKFASMGN